MDRRQLIGGIGLILAKPAIVHIENIMPIVGRYFYFGFSPVYGHIGIPGTPHTLGRVPISRVKKTNTVISLPLGRLLKFKGEDVEFIPNTIKNMSKVKVFYAEYMLSRMKEEPLKTYEDHLQQGTF